MTTFTDIDQVLSHRSFTGDLASHSVKSVGFTVSAQAVKIVLQIIAITILGRLLNPADFGLVAMITVFTGLAATFMDGGLSMATIQRQRISHEQVSILFWTNLGLGGLLCLVYLCASPLAATLYDERRLTAIMCVFSVFFLIGSMSVQHEALLKRKMSFRTLALIDVSASVVSVAVAIGAAFNGFGYWALVLQQIASISTLTCMRWLAIRWVPGGIHKGTGSRSLLGFGMNLTGANFVGYFTTNVTPFSIGLVGGAHQLGLFNRAFTLTSIPSKQLLPPVFKVFQSSLARVSTDEARLRRMIVSLMGKIALGTVLVSAIMVVTADWLVIALLGPGWENAIPLFRLLAIGAVATPITTFMAITLAATGESRALLRWKSVAFVILSGSILLGVPWGVWGIVVAHAGSGLFVRMPTFLWYSARVLPVTVSDHLRALAPCLAIGTITGTVLWLVRTVHAPSNPFLAIAIFGVSGTLLYLTLALSITSTRKDIVELAAYARLLKPVPRGGT